MLHFRSCADGRGFPPRGCVVGTRSRCAVSRSLWRRQPIALRSLRFCGNNLGVLGDLCGYPRGLRLRATIRQFLRELRRIPSSAHRAFGGRLPPASPAAMRRLVAASPRWVICEICGSGSRTQDRESCHRAAKPANAPTGSGGAFRRYGIPDSAGRHFPKKGRVGQNLTHSKFRITLPRNGWTGALVQPKHISPEYLKEKRHVAVVKPPSRDHYAFLRCERSQSLVIGSRPPQNYFTR